MEIVCVNECSVCPFTSISWLWYIIAVIVVFGLGALWYSVLFRKAWICNVGFECECKADLANGEKCHCTGGKSFLPMLFQFIATLLLGFMYFVLTAISIWLSVIVFVAVAAWLKASLKFKIMNWGRYMRVAAIEVGYFTVASILFVLFALL